MDKPKVPETMIQAVRYFADPQLAHDFFVAQRWPNGVACPRCGNAEVQALPKYRRWFCKDCKRQFTAKVGTIFEDSPIGFDKWLPAIWLISSNRNGISSCELARALAVTQKTAWFMLHRIRESMQNETFEKLTGVIEADETYIGGLMESKPLRVRRDPNRVKRTGGHNMTPVFGMVERGGNVRAWVLPHVTRQHLLPRLRDNVHHDATVFTDSATTYTHLDEHFLRHETVNHTIEEYVRGSVHTNTIENFWSVLKRTLGGTYISVRPWHLDKYLHEQIFRYNERENTDGPRFVKAVKGVDGRRLTYKKLIRKG
jgi:transposase-like protein